MANSFLWFVPTGNPAILREKDPWLSVPGLPLVWRIGGGPAILREKDPWLSVPGLPLVWRYNLISVNVTLTGDPAVLR